MLRLLLSCALLSGCVTGNLDRFPSVRGLLPTPTVDASPDPRTLIPGLPLGSNPRATTLPVSDGMLLAGNSVAGLAGRL